MLKKEFEFILQDELIYSHDGKAGLVAKKLLLRAPSCKLLGIANKLSSYVMGAFMQTYEKGFSNAQSQKSKKSSSVNTDEPITGDMCWMLLSSSFKSNEGVDFMDTFKELMVDHSVCLIDGKEPITSDLFDQIDAREMFRLVGEYVSNFLLPSIMNQSKKTT